MSLENEIQEVIDLETSAWDRKDAEALVDLFHPDMVWPWPPDPNSHDPVTWVFPLGRYERERWKTGWQQLFDDYELVHNTRETIQIIISKEGDGAFAVVEVDTLWRHRVNGELFHWKGRAGKGYTKVKDKWFLIYHTGLLKYGS